MAMGLFIGTLPGTHANKGAFLTRGSSKDEYARYTEDGAAYVRNMERLALKWQTIRSHMPAPEILLNDRKNKEAIIYFGTTSAAVVEALGPIDSSGNRHECIETAFIPLPGCGGGLY